MQDDHEQCISNVDVINLRLHCQMKETEHKQKFVCTNASFQQHGPKLTPLKHTHTQAHCDRECTHSNEQAPKHTCTHAAWRQQKQAHRHTHTHIHTHTHTHTHTCMHTHTHAHTNTHTHTYTYRHTHMPAHTHNAHTHTYTCPHTHTNMPTPTDTHMLTPTPTL